MHEHEEVPFLVLWWCGICLGCILASSQMERKGAPAGSVALDGTGQLQIVTGP